MDGVYYPWFSSQNNMFKRLFSIYKGMLVPIKLRPLQDFPLASQPAVDTLTTPYATAFSFSRILSFFVGALIVR